MVLIDDLIKDGWLKTPRIISAFRKINRVDFLPARIATQGVAGGPDNMKNLAEVNEALQIGYGQTISQPLTVAFMLEQLAPKEGDKILDVGAGSGWTTALLAHIVSGEQISNIKNQISKISGRVTAIEVVPELKEFGEKNVAKYNFVKKGIVKFILGNGSLGYEKEAPYDKILASASAEKLPEAWKKQLKVGGRIVAPIGNSIWLFIKKSKTDFEEIEYPGFAFVPLIEK
ncbi:MAG: protein-L-isoaspartate O-methyltransferase [Candidatus Pacebacteria bacterium]|nr:protein-L-isoaspartate O-methyltransferase [Candidatus Paceibacterota bacterium]